jgi:adenomatosis polyposis coli protein
MSFSSSTGMNPTSGMQGQRRLGAKMDVVYSLLSMLGSTEGREDMSATLLSMSNSVESCLVMRQSGCLPLLIQLIHAPGQDSETRERASRALNNIVHARTDEKSSRREARVLRLLEQLRDYCQTLRISLESRQPSDDLERHPGATIAALMKLSFDEAHRYAMCQLGGLHAVAELIEMDHTAHGSVSEDQNCITLRRYAGMALTNLTFGDGNNKALLCSFREFMKSLVITKYFI